MAEQEMKQKKKKEYFKKREDIRKPKVKDKICRMKSEGASYRNIKETLEEEYGISASEPTLKKIFKTETARGITNSPQMSARFSAMGAELTKRYKRSLGIVDKLVDMVDKLYEEYDAGSLDYLQVLNNSKKILNITKEVREQLEVLKEDQEDIKVKQQNMIYSPVQINMQLKKVFERADLCKECKKKFAESLGSDED